MQTARNLADQVVAARQTEWESSDSTVAIAAIEQLNPDDESVVDRIVEDAGFTGSDRTEMIRKVKARVVGQVGAQRDSSPVECS